MVRGPAKGVSMHRIRAQTLWSGRLFPRKSIMGRGLRYMWDVPQSRRGPIEADAQEPSKIHVAPLNPRNTEVHHHIIWVGYSQPSRTCAEKHWRWLEIIVGLASQLSLIHI